MFDNLWFISFYFATSLPKEHSYFMPHLRSLETDIIFTGKQDTLAIQPEYHEEQIQIRDKYNYFYIPIFY